MSSIDEQIAAAIAAGKRFPKTAAPSPAPASPLVSGNVLALIAGLAFAAFVLLPGLRNIGDNDSGGDVSHTVSVSRSAAVNYIAAIADAMDVCADDVDSSKIANKEQLQTIAQTYSKESRTRSFAPVDALDQQNIPDGEWSPGVRSAVSNHLRAKARGHRKAIN